MLPTSFFAFTLGITVTTPESVAPELIVNLFSPKDQPRVTQVVNNYVRTRQAFLAAERLLKAELATLTGGTSPPTVPQPLSVPTAPPRPMIQPPRPSAPAFNPKPAPTSSVEDTRRRTSIRAKHANLIGVSALRVYDVLVTLNSDRLPVPAADVMSLTRTGSSDKPTPLTVSEFGTALKALTSRGLVVEAPDGTLSHVPGRKVGYEHLYIPALAVTRLFRLNRPQTLAEIRKVVIMTQGLRSSDVSPSRIRNSLQVNDLSPFRLNASGAWVLAPKALENDPPVNPLADEPGFHPAPASPTPVSKTSVLAK